MFSSIWSGMDSFSPHFILTLAWVKSHLVPVADPGYSRGGVPTVPWIPLGPPIGAHVTLREILFFIMRGKITKILEKTVYESPIISLLPQIKQMEKYGKTASSSVLWPVIIHRRYYLFGTNIVFVFTFPPGVKGLKGKFTGINLSSYQPQPLVLVSK